MADIMDSGNRREFESGAVRDIAEGKGRCDLLPLEEVGFFLGWYFDARKDNNGISSDIKGIFKNLKNIYDFGDTSSSRVSPEYIYAVRQSISAILTSFSNLSDMGVPSLVLEVAIHFEDGARKYSARNWEKGIPAHCFVDSGIRHLIKFLRGDTDERHDRAFVWNMLCLEWTIANKPECNDLVICEEKENE